MVKNDLYLQAWLRNNPDVNYLRTYFKVKNLYKTISFRLVHFFSDSQGSLASHKKTEKKLSGLNFINVLRTAFTPVDPESVKRY